MVTSGHVAKRIPPTFCGFLAWTPVTGIGSKLAPMTKGLPGTRRRSFGDRPVHPQGADPDPSSHIRTATMSVSRAG
jgi:hypothetical protein